MAVGGDGLDEVLACLGSMPLNSILSQRGLSNGAQPLQRTSIRSLGPEALSERHLQAWVAGFDQGGDAERGEVGGGQPGRGRCCGSAMERRVNLPVNSLRGGPRGTIESGSALMRPEPSSAIRSAAKNRATSREPRASAMMVRRGPVAAEPR